MLRATPLIGFGRRHNLPYRLANLSIWWDPMDTSTIHEDTTSGRLSQLDDKSGNGYHATSLTTTNEPGVSGSEITFNGTDQHTGNESVAQPPSGGDMHIFCVATLAASPPFNGRFISWQFGAFDYADSSRPILYHSGVNNLRAYANGQMADQAGAWDGVKHVFHLSIVSNDVQIYVDNVIGTETADLGDDVDLPGVTVGQGDNANGELSMFELISVAGDLSGSSRTEIHDWLANKHGL